MSEKKKSEQKSKKSKRKGERSITSLSELQQIKKDLNSNVRNFVNNLGEAAHWMFDQNNSEEALRESVRRLQYISREIHFESCLLDLVAPDLGELMASELEIAADNFKYKFQDAAKNGFKPEAKELYEKFHQALLARAQGVRRNTSRYAVGLNLMNKILKIRSITLKGNEAQNFALEYILPDHFKEMLYEDRRKRKKF